MDAVEEIIANRVATLASRAQTRDVVDLYWHEQAGHHIELACSAQAVNWPNATRLNRPPLSVTLGSLAAGYYLGKQTTSAKQFVEAGRGQDALSPALDLGRGRGAEPLVRGAVERAKLLR